MSPDPYGHCASSQSYNMKASAVEDAIRFYIVRADKTMVPLVPVDQLPFSLQEIPRQLGYEDIGPGNWVFLKETREPAIAMHIEASLPLLSGHKHLAPDHRVKAESDFKRELNTNASSPVSPYSTSTFEKPLRSAPLLGFNRLAPHTEEHSTPLAESIASIYRHDTKRYNRSPHLPPSGIEPDLSKKEYCTHWIKTGECAFLSQGCKYKHEVPSLAKLRDLGFNTIPKWYKDKTAIKLTNGMRERDQAGSASRETTVGMQENGIFSRLWEKQGEAAASSRPSKSAPPAIVYEDLNSSNEIEDNVRAIKAQLAKEDLLIDLGSPVLAPTLPCSPPFSIRSASSSSESDISVASKPMSPTAKLVPRQEPTASTSDKTLTTVPTRRNSETSSATIESDKRAIAPEVNLFTKPKYKAAACQSLGSPRRVQEAVAPMQHGLASSKHAAHTTTTSVSKSVNEASNSSIKTQTQSTKARRDRQRREKKVRRELATTEHASV